MFANTTPRIKKRDADVSDSNVSTKTTKTAKTKIAPTDKSTSRLFLVVNNSCIPLTDAAIDQLDPATRSKVWVQHGNEAPFLLFPQVVENEKPRESSPSPKKQTKMDIYMEPKVKLEQAKHEKEIKHERKAAKQETKTPDTSDDEDEVQFVSVRSASAIESRSYIVYWREQYAKLKIQPREPPVSMKDLQRIPMDHPKLKFGTTMDNIGV